MPRSNSSVPRHRRHRKIVKLAKGYFGARSRNFKAAKDADCIMTDKWISMGDKGDKNKKKKALKKYQVNKKLMKVAKSDAIFMHCLPANREEEVTSEVMDGKQSVVWLQAFNRIHAQKSIIEWCMK